MNWSRSAERTRQEIFRLSRAGLDSRTFRVEAVRRLQKLIPIDASFFATADPATLLFTSAVVDDVLARSTPQFIENEFLKDDSVKFVRLARSRSPVDSLGVATKGDLDLSPRYREILAPMDLGDELRAALVVGSKCWGFVCLHRERSSSNFTPAEAAFLAKLTPHLATGIRTALLLGDGQAPPYRRKGRGWCCSQTISRWPRSRPPPRGGSRRWQRAIGPARSNCRRQSMPSPLDCWR